MEEKPNEKCCENCKFYKEQEERLICDDYDGLYFKWDMKPTERCPDFEKKKEIS